MDAIPLYQYDLFSNVAEEARDLIEMGIVIGWDSEDNLHLFGGGTREGRRLNAKDCLWLIEKARLDLMLAFDE